MHNNEGVTIRKENLNGCLVATVDVQTELAATRLGKPMGSYVSIRAKKRFDLLNDFWAIGDCLTELLGRMLRPYYHGKLCVCGVGNRDVPSDGIGQEVTSRLPLKVFSESGMKGNFSGVCSFSPGVEMTTNTRTELLVGGLVETLGVDCLLLVDSCVTNDAPELFRTIQIATTGGGSTYLAGRTADWTALGIPVISISVPMAIPQSAVFHELVPCGEILTSVMAHDVAATASTIIAYAIMRSCWPNTSREDCFILSKVNKDPLAYSSLVVGDPTGRKTR